MVSQEAGTAAQRLALKPNNPLTITLQGHVAVCAIPHWNPAQVQQTRNESRVAVSV